MRELDVMGVRVDDPSNVPVVLLREVGGRRYLPIWIGTHEAAAISQAIEGIVPPRPLTHDLLAGVLKVFDLKLQEVQVVDLKEGTFYGLLVFEGDVKVEARPSDAIALALRTGASITCAEAVLETAGVDLPEEEPEDEVEKFREFLDHVSPDDFMTGEGNQ